MNPIDIFNAEVTRNVTALGADVELSHITNDWIKGVSPYNYTHNFTFLGRPIIQFPQDMVAIQELIWKIRPDLIIETGIAHGGSLVLSAAMLALLDMTDAIESDTSFNPKESKRKVLGIDIEIREHNRIKIQTHAMASRISMIEGSSVDPATVAKVWEFAKDYSRILVCLDSNHTHEHVLAELVAYSPLVTPQSYCIVYDTAIEDFPDEMFPDRPWGPGNSPKTAVWEFLKTNSDFEIDQAITNKLLISVAPDGFLRRI